MLEKIGLSRSGRTIFYRKCYTGINRSFDGARKPFHVERSSLSSGPFEGAAARLAPRIAVGYHRHMRWTLSISLILLTAAGPAAAAELEIPRPDLSAMEEAARSKIESMQGALEELVGRGDIPPAELAEAFGHLGQLFHAYRLLDSAEVCYLESRRLAPGDYRWPYYLGLVRHAEGELETAVADYLKVLELKPDDRPALLRLGDALLELDRVEEARARYARLRELDPDNAAALYGLGKAAGFADDYARAVELFERVLELQPEATVVHYLLGQAYRKLGDLDKAREHLTQRGQDDVSFTDPLGDQISRLSIGTAFEIVLALAKSADEFSDAEFLGFALSHFGDVRGSIEQLEQGLALKQESEASSLEQARIHYVLGGLLVNDDRDTEAISHFRQALELAPELDDARVKLGNALARGGDLEDAIGAYSRVIERRPDDVEVRLKRVSALMELGRDAEARSDLERLLELAPERSEVHVRLATLLEKSGEVAAAIACYRAAEKLELGGRERPRVHHRLAGLMRQQGDAEGALEQYGKAVSADAAFVPAVAGRASLLAQLGRMEEAADVYNALVELEPDQARHRMAEVTALILSGQHAAARDRLEAAMARFPEDLGFKDVLARHLAACPDRAVRDGARALELSLELFEAFSSPQTVETLAMAYAEAGRFAEAVDWQKKLIAEIEDEFEPEELARMRANLALYERGDACCAEPGS